METCWDQLILLPVPHLTNMLRFQELGSISARGTQFFSCCCSPQHVCTLIKLTGAPMIHESRRGLLLTGVGERR